MTKSDDLKMGADGEDFVKPLLEKYFNTTLKNKWKYCLIDFEDDERVVEVKTRRVGINTYPTIYIPQYKLDYVKENNKTFFACFNLYDGVYIFNITENIDICDITHGGRMDRGKNEMSYMINCPCKMFIKIN